ncbi:Shedu immune nuclease family protein [Nonomuraea sp. NPDC050556]|uniref:Shedu immune nuclease family protein n=1 Tax=Nonomuraea sp. NPDC050556 TaxID=3364369 RepID=UPI003798AFE6
MLVDITISRSALDIIRRNNPMLIRDLIADDKAIQTLVAIKLRRAQVDRFRRLLNDDSFFDSEAVRLKTQRKEDVWQGFFEDNPWILGAMSPGQLFTSWDRERLEKIAAGAFADVPGKRADALMRTSGIMSSLVFVELKTHLTPLVENREYRSGCFAPSRELAGGVTQAQGTVHLAANAIRERYADLASDGSEIPGQFTYLIQPRSFLIIGSLDQLKGEQGGDHTHKVRSFELFRRQLHGLEVITFDELLARVEWTVAMDEEH